MLIDDASLLSVIQIFVNEFLIFSFLNFEQNKSLVPSELLRLSQISVSKFEVEDSYNLMLMTYRSMFKILTILPQDADVSCLIHFLDNSLIMPSSCSYNCQKIKHQTLNIKQGYALKNWVEDYLIKPTTPGNRKNNSTKIGQPYIHDFVFFKSVNFCT